MIAMRKKTTTDIIIESIFFFFNWTWPNDLSFSNNFVTIYDVKLLSLSYAIERYCGMILNDTVSFSHNFGPLDSAISRFLYRTTDKSHKIHVLNPHLEVNYIERIIKIITPPITKKKNQWVTLDSAFYHSIIINAYRTQLLPYEQYCTL